MSASSGGYFGSRLFAFLSDLAENNHRDWFQANKSRYEDDLKDPALRFISDVGPHLETVSRHIRADPRPVGGSLFRIYRDVRFAKDKSPYKTHCGIQFRHKAGADAHAPGFYLHLEPAGCFVCAGVWSPAGPALQAIRQAIDSSAPSWRKATGDAAFRERFELAGDSLARAPKGFPADHPLLDDLKRKDFYAMAPVSLKEVGAADFPERFTALCATATPFMRFLCKAVDAPF
jgi:uncharacterized protein (TIGR02453 family)